MEFGGNAPRLTGFLKRIVSKQDPCMLLFIYSHCHQMLRLLPSKDYQALEKLQDTVSLCLLPRDAVSYLAY